MKPGLELDILIAEKVFGHTVIKRTWGKQKQYCSYTIGEPEYYDISGDMQLQNYVLAYSIDIKCAWEIVDTIRGWAGVFEFKLAEDYEGLWHCVFNFANEGESVNVAEHNGDTAPHAICLAALKVLK